MKISLNNVIIGTVIVLIFSSFLYSQDTSYHSLATQKILRMVKPGKAPVFTIQISFLYDIGLMDMASNDNTSFRKDDFVNGRNFGTRYGIGGVIIGKIALHKAGNVRLNIISAYNRFQSDLIISSSPEGKVLYNVFSWGVGLENCFNPDRRFKPFIGFELLGSLISGKATINTDTSIISLKIKNSFRFGGSVYFGFEYAVARSFGFNMGIKFTNANLLLKESKASSNSNEINLNDQAVTPKIPYSGWKQFFYASFNAGVNIYFGAKHKK